MSVWKHFTSTNIWMKGWGIVWVMFSAPNFSFLVSRRHLQEIESVWKPCCQLSDVLPNHLATCTPPKMNGNLKITVLIHLNHPPPFLDWCNYLVGGFNPFEKYSSKWESSPSRVENKKYLKPPPSYSTTSFERFHIQLRSLVVARLIWFALERSATRRVCILWEYSSASATIVDDDDDAELISKWTD